MIHARADYNNIHDLDAKIPDNEPVFLLRGQDKHTARVIRFYADCVDADDGDPGIIEGCRHWADVVDAWDTHKAPDL